MRHENGNCLPAGGFCKSDTELCIALSHAYNMGQIGSIYMDDTQIFKRGAWIVVKYLDTKVNTNFCHVICSECRSDIVHDWEHKPAIKNVLNNYKYCPNCGVKMDVERKEK